MLRVQDLNVSIDAVHILRGVSLELPTGSMIGLIGRNGAGKTTLMKTIMGILKPSGGSLRFGDTDLAGVPNHARARIGIGYMPDDRRLIPDLTVEENVLVPAWASGARDVRERLEKVYSLVPEVKELGPRKGSQLSGGQQKLAALARALMCGTKLLLLDEPTSGVSAEEKFGIMQMVLDAVRAEGATVLFVEHDMAVVARYAHRVLAFYDGRIIADGPPDTVLADPDVRRYVVGEALAHKAA